MFLRRYNLFLYAYLPNLFLPAACSAYCRTSSWSKRKWGKSSDPCDPSYAPLGRHVFYPVFYAPRAISSPCSEFFNWKPFIETRLLWIRDAGISTSFPSSSLLVYFEEQKDGQILTSSPWPEFKVGRVTCHRQELVLDGKLVLSANTAIPFEMRARSASRSIKIEIYR